MTAKYIQPGEIMEYKSEQALKFGDVVNLGSRIGVAANHIAAGEVGSVAVVGVFELPKAAVDADITCGTALYWDAENEGITTAEGENGNIPAGYAWSNAAKADNKILVKLLG